MSLAANKFERKYTGFTVFGNEIESKDISDWNIDQEFEAQMAVALSKLGYQPVRMSYDRKDFVHVYDVHGPWDAPAYRTPNWDAIQGSLTSLAEKNSLDAVIVVASADSPDFLADTNQFLRGAGFYSRGIGGRTKVSVLHFFASVAIVDGHTGKVLATRWLSTIQEGNWGEIARASPMADVSPDLSRAQLSAIDAKTWSDIRLELVGLPKDAWEPTFKALMPTH